MKHNSKKFLALFVAASMAVTPVSGVYAEDQNASVENASGDNVENGSDAGQSEVNANTVPVSEGQTSETENNAQADGNQTANNKAMDTETVKNVQNNPVSQNQENIQNKSTAQNEQKTETAVQNEATAEDEIFDITNISGDADGLTDGEYQADSFSCELAKGGKKKVDITCQKIVIKNGKATAWIHFNSSHYNNAWVNFNGNQSKYVAKSANNGVIFQIPVDVNKEMTFMTHTDSMGGKNIAYKMNITISKGATPSTPEQTVVTGLSFSEGAELNMKAGEVQKLTPSFTPALTEGQAAPEVTWSSSDPAVVKVAKSGTQAEVTAVKAGTAEITASIKNNDGTEIKAVCKVTVKAPETENKTLTDGSYQVDVTSNASMFKVINCILTSEKGKMYAVITLSGTGYDRLYMGTASDAAKATAKDYIPYVVNQEGKYTYKIPVESLDKGIAVAAHSKRLDTWYDRTLIFSSASAKRVIADGKYKVNVANDGNGMFVVVNCILTVKEGKMTAAVTLKGHGYNKIYLGNKEDAPNHENEWILPESILAERYTFHIPVEKLDKKIQIAAHGSEKWYAKTLIFNSEGMIKISEGDNGNSSNGNNGGNGSLTPGGNNGSGSGNGSNGNTGNNSGNAGNVNNTNNKANNGKPDTESKYESDLNKSTVRVNSATGLKDGVYTPDSFSWSGGTGKVSISCNKVTVTGGQAYATITFSSTHFQYVKANGNVYYPSSKTGSSTSFVIPVELNKNNSIIGMTTAMSTAHEIRYSIFVYIAEAAKSNAAARANGKEVTVIGMNGSNSSKTAAASKKLDEVAPEIIGLEYQSETKAEHVKYFKIYHYDQGITLLEIDMSKKTGRKAAGKKWKQSSETSGLNPAEQEQAGLYLNKVVKYLIVPENAEIPAGLDKEVIVIKQPADHIYAGTNKMISTLDELGQLDKVMAVGVKKAKCKNETIKDKLNKKEVVYAGTSAKLNYKKLVKKKCNLALVSSKVLPKKGSSKKAAKKKMRKYQKMTEKMTLLQMPVIVDRSQDEKNEEAKKEWQKVYQVILGCEDQNAEQ